MKSRNAKREARKRAFPHVRVYHNMHQELKKNPMLKEMLKDERKTNRSTRVTRKEQ